MSEDDKNIMIRDLYERMILDWMEYEDDVSLAGIKAELEHHLEVVNVYLQSQPQAPLSSDKEDGNSVLEDEL